MTSIFLPRKSKPKSSALVAKATSESGDEKSADERRHNRASRIGLVLAVLIPAIIYVIHASIFGGWLIDDAGISFAYARNLAQGHGLVAQPGLEPIEGYSNFAWVLLIALLFKIGVFVIPMTPKILSGVFVVLTYVTLLGSLSFMKTSFRLVACLSLSFVSLNPSFVLWTVSGLENPLLVFLSSVLLFQILYSTYEKNKFLGSPYAIALTVAMISVTRPDGIIYSAAFPISFLLLVCVYREEKYFEIFKILIIYFLSLLTLFGTFIFFRYLYFNDLFPNTYYAKGGPGIEDVRDLLLLMPYATAKMSYLFPAAGGPVGALSIAMIVIAVPFLAGKGRLHVSRLIVLLFLVQSAGAYVLLPDDWMGEYRFATVFFLLYSVSVFLIFSDIIDFSCSKTKSKNLFIIVFFVVLVVICLGDFTRRTTRIAQNPPVPFAIVAETIAERYHQYTEVLSIEKCSVLIPDVGGMLYASDLRIYDLGGLCDRTIAESLGKNKAAFYDYVFEVIKPTFIDSHGVWGRLAAFEEDFRFGRDYTPFSTFLDFSGESEGKPPIRSGRFVRRDVISREELEVLRGMGN